MAEIVGVKFREDGRVYSFDSKGIKFKVGDYAVVDTARGMECGMIAKENSEVSEEELVKPLKSVIRAATEEPLRLNMKEISRAISQRAPCPHQWSSL